MYLFLQGDITVQEKLDHETTSSYSIIIKATSLQNRQYFSHTVVRTSGILE